MKPPIVIIGIGELASVFARAFLRNGYPVYPITRSMNIAEEAENLPEAQLVLVAVAENNFHEVMETIPAQWRKKLVLLQNELLPRDWLAHETRRSHRHFCLVRKKEGHGLQCAPAFAGLWIRSRFNCRITGRYRYPLQHIEHRRRPGI